MRAPPPTGTTIASQSRRGKHFRACQIFGERGEEEKERANWYKLPGCFVKISTPIEAFPKITLVSTTGCKKQGSGSSGVVVFSLSFWRTERRSWVWTRVHQSSQGRGRTVAPFSCRGSVLAGEVCDGTRKVRGMDWFVDLEWTLIAETRPEKRKRNE